MIIKLYMMNPSLSQSDVDKLKRNFVSIILRLPEFRPIDSDSANHLLDMYTIRFDPNLVSNQGNRIKGILKVKQRTIIINNSFPIRQQKATLIHEWIHILDLGMNYSDHKIEKTKQSKVDKMDIFASNKTTQIYFRLLNQNSV